MADYWERYQAGDHEAVWTELIALGEGVYRRDVMPEAERVASEIMRRAAQNLRTLAARLEQSHYQFRTTPESGSPLAGINFNFGALHTQFGNMAPEAQKKMGGPGMVAALQNLVGFLQKAPASPPRKIPAVEPPPAAAKKHLREMEHLLDGNLPLSLRAWYEHADGVCFLGVDPELNPAPVQAPPAVAIGPAAFGPAGNHLAAQQQSIAQQFGFRVVTTPPATDSQPLPDPIVLMPLQELLDEIEECAAEGFPGPVALAPDDLHKANISGATWDMNLPCAAADAPFGRWPGLVAYLREVCAWGGFPGWSREPNAPRERIALLAQDLLPF
jgi:hypothetical protein